VPFPWGSPLSGVKDEAEIAWYARTVRTPAAWKGQRVFLVIGAADWRTTVWLDGHELGSHEGGYTPFEFDLTPHVRFGEDQRLVIRVDDVARDFKLEGKQGYGNARGIWQTPYLEARGTTPLDVVHFSPDIERGEVHVDARLLAPAPGPTSRSPSTSGRAACRARPSASRAGPTGCGSRCRCPRRACGGSTIRSSTRSRRGSRARHRGRRRPDLLRDAADLGGRPARHHHPLHRAERRARLPAARARPGLPSAGLLHLPDRRVHEGRGRAGARHRAERPARAREGAAAAEAVLGRPARDADHGRRAERVGRAGPRACGGTWSTRCAR
jgi:hypothetical protein